MYFVRDILWGELQNNGSVSVSFSTFQDDELLSESSSIEAPIHIIQQAIAAYVRGEETSPSDAISIEEAQDLYSAISQNTELFFE